jgi:hypothetical protein
VRIALAGLAFAALFSADSWAQVPAVPQTWGAVAGSASDQTPYFAAALASLCAAGGGRLAISGPYPVHDLTIPCGGVYLDGAGIGGSNLAPGGQPLSGLAGALFDCRAMINFCVQFKPNPYPAPRMMVGGGVSGITMRGPCSQNADHDSWGCKGAPQVAIDVNQVSGIQIRNNLLLNMPNAVRVNSSFASVIEDNGIRGTYGNAIEVSGDMSGFNSAGGPCNLADCSTRTDLTRIRNNNGFMQATGTVLYIHDAAFTTYPENNEFEGGAGGLKVRCAPGQPHLGYCPQQIIAAKFETEYSAAPYDLQDFSYFKCLFCYGAGAGFQATPNVVAASLVNYAQGKGAGGSVVLIGGLFYNAGKSCLNLMVDDTVLMGNSITDCSGSAPGVYAGVEYAAGTQQHTESANIYCQNLGVPGTQMLDVLVGDGASPPAGTETNLRNGCVKAGP